MKLRFNKGAVVSLSIRGLNSSKIVIGKVVDVLPDEVEICPQFGVRKNGNLLHNYTADAKNTMHIRRELIWSWEYALFSEIIEFLPISAYTNNTLNEYGPDGFCKGSGPSFASVKEESTTMTDLSLIDDGK